MYMFTEDEVDYWDTSDQLECGCCACCGCECDWLDELAEWQEEEEDSNED